MSQQRTEPLKAHQVVLIKFGKETDVGWGNDFLNSLTMQVAEHTDFGIPKPGPKPLDHAVFQGFKSTLANKNPIPGSNTSARI